MTREEAIKLLKEYAQFSNGIWHNDEEDTKAFDMAIEALQDRPTGTWTKREFADSPMFLTRRYYCSHCGDWNTYGMPDFCPNCGADMRGGADD